NPCRSVGVRVHFNLHLAEQQRERTEQQLRGYRASSAPRIWSHYDAAHTLTASLPCTVRSGAPYCTSSAYNWSILSMLSPFEAYKLTTPSTMGSFLPAGACDVFFFPISLRLVTLLNARRTQTTALIADWRKLCVPPSANRARKEPR